MATKPGTLLTDVAGFPKAVADRLAELWLTTAEELMSAANQAAGKISLATFLNVSSGEVNTIVAQPRLLSRRACLLMRRTLSSRWAHCPWRASRAPRMSRYRSPSGRSKIDLHDRMPPVRNQGIAGPAWRMPCPAVREYLLGEQSGTADLSEQFIFWACKQQRS